MHTQYYFSLKMLPKSGVKSTRLILCRYLQQQKKPMKHGRGQSSFLSVSSLRHCSALFLPREISRPWKAKQADPGSFVRNRIRFLIWSQTGYFWSDIFFFGFSSILVDSRIRGFARFGSGSGFSLERRIRIHPISTGIVSIGKLVGPGMTNKRIRVVLFGSRSVF